MRCPFCGSFIENSLSIALRGVQTDPPIVITNVDYIIEVGKRITAIIEEKHSRRHFANIYQLITLKKVAQSLGVPLLILFVDDLLEETTVYDVPINVRFPSSRFYNFERFDPLFIGDYKELGEFILNNLVYHVPSVVYGRDKKFRR